MLERRILWRRRRPGCVRKCVAMNIMDKSDEVDMRKLTLISTLWADGTSCLSFAEALSRAMAEISAMTTLAPSLAKRMHVSSPMPL